MKSTVFILAISLSINFTSFSQEINKLSTSVPISRGKIILSDRVGTKFKNLNLKNDTIEYIDSKGEANKKSIKEVYKITKSGTYAGYGALSGFLIGLSASLLTEGQYQMDLESGYVEETDGRFGIYAGVTAGCTALGGLVGLLFKKEKTLYINLTQAMPSSQNLPITDNRKYSVLSLKFIF